MKSVIQDEKECYLCEATQDLHDHHIFFGPNRQLSEKYGLKIWLCARHHNMSDYSAHFDKTLDLQFKKTAQRKFEETHTREEFLEVFGRNYLDGV